MQKIVLTLKEFKETFEYNYSDLKISLETSKDGDFGERLIIINDLNNLNKISYAIKEIAYKDGYDDADYHHIVELSSSSI